MRTGSMAEQDYITATNLAKLRIALDVLRGVLDTDRLNTKQIKSLICAEIAKLEKEVLK